MPFLLKYLDKVNVCINIVDALQKKGRSYERPVLRFSPACSQAFAGMTYSCIYLRPILDFSLPLMRNLSANRNTQTIPRIVRAMLIVLDDADNPTSSNPCTNTDSMKEVNFPKKLFEVCRAGVILMPVVSVEPVFPLPER